jgi:hypothetical protein
MRQRQQISPAKEPNLRERCPLATHASFAELLVRLSPMSIANEIREEHSRQVVGEQGKRDNDAQPAVACRAPVCNFGRTAVYAASISTASMCDTPQVRHSKTYWI